MPIAHTEMCLNFKAAYNEYVMHRGSDCISVVIHGLFTCAARLFCVFLDLALCYTLILFVLTFVYTSYHNLR